MFVEYGVCQTLLDPGVLFCVSIEIAPEMTNSHFSHVNSPGCFLPRLCLSLAVVSGYEGLHFYLHVMLLGSCRKKEMMMRRVGSE